MPSPITNSALAEQIKGLGTVVTEQIKGLRNELTADVDGLRREVKAVGAHVERQNSRLASLETARVVSETERETLKSVATADRQHNREVEEKGWTRKQIAAATAAVVVASPVAVESVIKIVQLAG